MNKHKGFVALISMVLISTVLSIIVLEASSQAYFIRTAVEGHKNKIQSYYLARSCMEIAKNTLQRDTSYYGNELIFISSWQCTIGLIDTSSGSLRITTHAQVNTSKTTLTEYF